MEHHQPDLITSAAPSTDIQQATVHVESAPPRHNAQATLQSPVASKPLDHLRSGPISSDDGAESEYSIDWRKVAERKDVVETHTRSKGINQETGRPVINGYEFLGEIGRGQHGKVKKAKRIAGPDEGETVAIKIVNRNTQRMRLGKVQEPENRIRKEIAILKQCRHPNIVSLIEVIDDNELRKAYLVLEFVTRGEVIWRTEGDTAVIMAERERIEAEMLEAIGVLPGGETLAEYGLRTGREARHRRQQAEFLRARTLEWSMGDEAESRDDRSSIPPAPADVAEHQTADDDAPTPRIEPANHFEDPSMAESEPHLPLDHSVKDFAATNGNSIHGIAHVTFDNEQINAHTRSPTMELEHVDSPAPRSRASSLSRQPTSECPTEHHDTRSHLHYRNQSIADSSFDRLSTGYASDPFEEDFSYVPCLSMAHARMTFRDTVLGLEYLHYNEIIHRDIKPANLLWTNDKHTKISDFGVSYLGKKMDSEKGPNTTKSEQLDEDRDLARTVGTPSFLAPELVSLETQHRISNKIDLWSLGVTLYCLIFARLPFLAKSEFQLFKIVSTQPLFIPRKRLYPVQLPHVHSSSSNVASPTSQRNSPPIESIPTSPDRADPRYEEIGDDLRDLLSRLLVKSPEDRISLKEVKHHPWVVAGLPDPALWLKQTDVEQFTSGKKIDVSDQDLEKAFVPLTIMDKIKVKLGTLGTLGGFLNRGKDRSASSEDRIPRVDSTQGKEKVGTVGTRSRAISGASSTEGSTASTPHGPSGLSREATPPLGSNSDQGIDKDSDMLMLKTGLKDHS